MRVILVHGGSGSAKADEAAEGAYREGLLQAAEAGYAALARGGDAVAAVIAAVRTMEDLPAFNAGYGSVLNARGEVECDAAVMRGSDCKFGAVAAVKGVPNPILLARLVLDSRRVMFAGRGGERFGEEHGLARCDPAQLITQERFAAWGTWMASGQPNLESEEMLEGCDTVGAVALDAGGALAAATSTGGVSFKPPGRVGDSPLPGCGFWADGFAATSSTGEGEKIARVLLCREAAQLLSTDTEGQGDRALDVALRSLDGVGGGSAGLIGLTVDGQVHASYNTEIMGHAWRSDWMAEAMVAGTTPGERGGPG